MTGPRCGNNPHAQLSDGDRKAVEEFKEYLTARRGKIVMCFTRCEPCMQNFCFDPPEEHSWAGADDLAHARENDLPEPTGICACDCARPTA